MSNKFPHSKLFIASSRAIVISGPHIQVIDCSNGDIIHSTADFGSPDKEAIIKSGPIRCAAVSRSHETIATSGDDKLLKVWRVDGLRLLSQRELPKKPASIRFTRDEQTILVSDKFGDIFSYPLHPSTAQITSEKSNDAFASHVNLSGGKLVLGHASVLCAFTLSQDEQYIVSADRDEHIRISWYPQGFNIERHCLGHRKYVSAVHIPAFAPSILISGGGDPVLKLWDWMSGVVQHEIKIIEAVAPFIIVRGRRRGDINNGEDNADGAAKGSRAKGRKRKGQEKRNMMEKEKNEFDGSSKEAGDGVATKLSTVSEDSGGKVGRTPAEADGQENLVDSESTVLVIHKIESFETEHGRFLLFSAVGAIALFLCPFPTVDAATPAVVSFDLGKPILDFILDDGLIWVLLDMGWSTNDLSSESNRAVKTLRWTGNEFAENNVSDGPVSHLWDSLNSKCLIEADPDELCALDLYSEISSLPKTTIEWDRGGTEKDVSEVPPTEESAPLTKRQLGRLKNKKKLQEKLAHPVTESGDGDDGSMPKRPKSEELRDVVMTDS